MDNSYNPSYDPMPDFLLGEETPQKFPWINVVLFLVTCLTTTIMGTVVMADFHGTMQDGLWAELGRSQQNPIHLLTGLPFSLALMTILFAHEMGHYLTCRYYGIAATLPFFIPAPTLIGTMGAFIRIQAPIHNRAALLEMGIAGPIAGFVMVIPLMALGLHWSQAVPLESVADSFSVGAPLLLNLLWPVFGKTPDPGMVLSLHPVLLAALFGCLVTTLNLLPIGQLDGGHVTYGLFRGRHKAIAISVLGLLIPMGLLFWHGWLVWFILPLALGYRHPPTVDDGIPLSRRHTVLGWIAVAMFILCFTPRPFA